MPRCQEVVRILLKPDLEAAGIPYVDDAGRFADFHALRHSFITHLGRADGVHFKTAQELAGHSTPTLTARYTHGFKGDEVAAVNALPDLSPPTHEAQKATGTDDTAPNRLALCLAQEGGIDETLADSNGLKQKVAGQVVSAGRSRTNSVVSTPKKPPGEVPERLKGPVSKTGVRFAVPWVRIPPSPLASSLGPRFLGEDSATRNSTSANL